MAQIDFYAAGYGINLNGSGLAFFGANGGGSSVAVGEYQDVTFVSNSAGTSYNQQANNVKYANSMSGYINSNTSGTLLNYIPNYLSTLEIRFTHGSAVKVQNTKVRCYDRSSINNDPSGLICKAAEIAHPSTSLASTGSGSDTTWTSIAGSGSILSLNDCPGTSGFYNTGTSARSDTWHSWYLALSQSPSSIGSKLSSLYVSTEYI